MILSPFWAPEKQGRDDRLEWKRKRHRVIYEERLKQLKKIVCPRHVQD